MSWWSIIKISEDAKRSIMGRFGSKKDSKKPKSVGQSFGTKGKDATSAYKNCFLAIFKLSPSPLT